MVILEGKKSSVIIETHDTKYTVRWEIELMHDGLGEACTEKLQSFASMDFTGLHHPNNKHHRHYHRHH